MACRNPEYKDVLIDYIASNKIEYKKLLQTDLCRNPESMDRNQVTSLSLDTRIPEGMTVYIGITHIG